MQLTTFEQRQGLAAASREAIHRHQWARCRRLLAGILPANRFYAEKLGAAGEAIRGGDDANDANDVGENWELWRRLPVTLKSELVEDSQHPGLAANLTYPPDEYVRFHRTSGTRGRPLVVLDSAGDWQWWMDCWQYVLDAVGLTSHDRVLMAFSFGPFIGFWSAHDAVIARGAMVIPTGGMSSIARLEMAREMRATTLFCTPSYAIHLSQVAAEHQIAPGHLSVRKIVVAGEPGGSIPSIREQIENAWQAEVFDHSGASEVGPWGISANGSQGLLVNEAEFLPEFFSVADGRQLESGVDDGELSELVITTLGRFGSPVIRFRTGDLVRPRWGKQGFVLLEGGVLGRTDDMMIIRGVNIFPSSIEQILRSFPEVVEYRMVAYREGAMDALRIEVEDRMESPQRIADELYLRLGLRVAVAKVPLGSLPRFELKGRRFVDERVVDERVVDERVVDERVVDERGG